MYARFIVQNNEIPAAKNVRSDKRKKRRDVTLYRTHGEVFFGRENGKETVNRAAMCEL